MLSASLVVLAAFLRKPQPPQQTLQGAWQMKTGDTAHLLIATDGYLSHTAYAGKTFLFTKGGPFERKADGLHIKWEYDTQTPDNVGTQSVVATSGTGNNLVTTAKDGVAKRWTQLDAGQSPLAGAWQITQRMQDGSMQTIHQTGTRKTVKLLTGSMFQWVAIDPGAKGFYGTGGGRYTFTDGKYTEHIDFFSRDSSRVGTSLSFSGKVEGGNWHHSGKSSRGDDIHEVWSRGRK
ncbi:membrane or secreted protein [Paracnuella aquatica]|nr:membrane or secreted protein [Paracnuella aquatica]